MMASWDACVLHSLTQHDAKSCHAVGVQKGLYSLSTVLVQSCSAQPTVRQPPHLPPGAPGGPAGPGRPDGPVSPFGPVGPRGPVGPVGPSRPVGPVSPFSPRKPVGPRRPVGPVGPRRPSGPVSPRAPVGPRSPGGPVMARYLAKKGCLLSQTGLGHLSASCQWWL
jgi:hypothetical protein